MNLTSVYTRRLFLIDFRFKKIRIILTKFIAIDSELVLRDDNVGDILFKHLDPIVVAVDKTNGQIQVFTGQFVSNTERQFGRKGKVEVHHWGIFCCALSHLDLIKIIQKSCFLFFFYVPAGHPLSVDVPAHHFVELSLTQESESSERRNLVLPGNFGSFLEPNGLLLHAHELLLEVVLGEVYRRFIARSNPDRRKHDEFPDVSLVLKSVVPGYVPSETMSTQNEVFQGVLGVLATF